MTRRVRLIATSFGYVGGLVLHTATSGPVPRLDEIRLVVEADGRIAALGATRINIAYLGGPNADEIRREVLDAAGALDWSVPWETLAAQLDERFPDLVAPARMLFEMAAADGLAREAGISVAEHLGAARAPSSTPTNQTLFWGEDSDLLARAYAFAERGFLTLKLRIGIGPFAADLRRLRLLRDRLGPALRLSVDVNGQWSEAEAPERLDALAPFALDYVEQPLASDAWGATAALAKTSPIPIMLDESLSSIAAVRRLADTGAAPLAHLKLAKLGGLDRMCEAARRLRSAGIGVMIGQMNEGAVSTAAAAHAAVALDVSLRELYGADGLADEPSAPALRYADGELHLPAGPGLGLSHHPVSDTTPPLWEGTT